MMRWLALLLIAVACASTAEPGALERALTAIGDRRPGPSGDRAAAVVAEQLAALGIEPILIRHAAVVPETRTATLVVDGRSVAVAPLAPNGAATAATDGVVEAELAFVGDGSPAAIGGRDLDGRIAVLDGRSRDRWTLAAQLGARAVLVRLDGGESARELAALSLTASIAMPRAAVAAADLPVALDGRRAALALDVRWTRRMATTVAALVPAASGAAKANELVVLAAAHGTSGPLPNAGALRAANAQVLLDTVAALKARPAQRGVLAVFHADHGSAMRGLRLVAAALAVDRSADGWKDDGQLAALDRWTARRTFDAGIAADGIACIAALEKPDAAAIAAAIAASLDAAGEPPDGGPFAEIQLRREAPVLRLLSQALGERATSEDAAVAALHRAQPPAEESAVRAAAERARTWRTAQQRLSADVLPTDDDAPLVPQVLARAAAVAAEQARHLQAQGAELAALAQLRARLAGQTAVHLVGLDLSDGAGRFSARLAGPNQTWVEELHGIPAAWGRAAAQSALTAGAVYAAEPHAVPGEADAWWSERTTHEAAWTGIYLPSSSLSTITDSRPRLGAPADRPESIDRTAFAAQAAAVPDLVRAFAGQPDLGRFRPKVRDFAAPRVAIEVRAVGTRSGKRGLPFPLVALRFPARAEDTTAEVEGCERVFADGNGVIRAAFLPRSHPGTWSGTGVLAWGLDHDGRIAQVLATAGTLKGEKPQLANGQKSALADILATAFDAAPSAAYRLWDPRLLAAMPTVKVLSASREAAPELAHVEQDGAHAAVFAEAGTLLRLTAGPGNVDRTILLLGRPDAKAAGGFAGYEAGVLGSPTALDAAVSMHGLNERRLTLLRESGVSSDSLTALHARAERDLVAAQAARAGGDLQTALARAEDSWALSARVYPRLTATANDVVRGLVVLLAFAIPFALLCERLLVAAPTIGGRVGWFAAFFIAVFAFFYGLHPAFALATTPMVVFLAFVILLMSVWVTWIIAKRFELEMKQLRAQDGAGIFEADVSRLGTALATIGLGISSMRRRQVRTALTAATVVLMTFILLTFAGLEPTPGTSRTAIDAPAPYRGIDVRLGGWAPLGPGEAANPVADRLRGFAGREFVLHERRWFAPSARQQRIPLLAGGASASVPGVLAVGPADPSGAGLAAVRGDPADPAAARGTEPGWLFLPPAILGQLGIAPGAEVRLRGVALHAGVVDAARLDAARAIGGEPLTPLALDLLDKKQADEAARLAAVDASGAPAAEGSNLVHLPASAVALMHPADAAHLGADLRSVALIPADAGVDVSAAADRLAATTAIAVRVADRGESALVVGASKVSVSGLSAVAVPLLLGGLIIFATMLNSVAERGKEIFIYSSLGLAPLHVAALFLVEASIYAVLGGLGGYLLAQGMGWILSLMAAAGWAEPPAFNFSGTTAVATILLVMLTVLLSALWPALLAARAASPGDGAQLVLPEPEGDRIRVAFPFTVAQRDIDGLLAFLAAWFRLNSEASTGSFTAANAALHADDDPAVSATVWLAPFDLGVSQRFRLAARPTDVRAISRIHLQLELLSGQRATWTRANAAFLRELRLQFLVWRTLPKEVQQRFREEGAAALKRTPTPERA